MRGAYCVPYCVPKFMCTRLNFKTRNARSNLPSELLSSGIKRTKGRSSPIDIPLLKLEAAYLRQQLNPFPHSPGRQIALHCSGVTLQSSTEFQSPKASTECTSCVSHTGYSQSSLFRLCKSAAILLVCRPDGRENGRRMSGDCWRQTSTCSNCSSSVL